MIKEGGGGFWMALVVVGKMIPQQGFVGVL